MPVDEFAPYAGTPLTVPGTDTRIIAADLCKDKPVLVLAIRRPGCVLCRAQALKVWEARGDFERAGCSVAVVVHEWIDREMKAFAPDYWGGTVYHDQDKQFYKLLHGGQLKKGSIAAMLNPFSKAWKNIRQAQKTVTDYNTKGDGMTFGGMVLLGTGGSKVVRFPEVDFGEYAPLAEVLEAAKKL